MDSYTLTGLLEETPLGYLQQALDESPAEDVAAFERVIRKARLMREIVRDADPMSQMLRQMRAEQPARTGEGKP